MEYLAPFVKNPDCLKQDEVCDGQKFCADGQDETGCGKWRRCAQAVFWLRLKTWYLLVREDGRYCSVLFSD
jgi:hypothetical protein